MTTGEQMLQTSEGVAPVGIRSTDWLSESAALNRQAKPLTFSVIVADPPWEYPEGFYTCSHNREKKTYGATDHAKPLPYPAMSVDEICALGVKELADKDCRLWLWTTSRYLPAAFRVMAAWGFEYRQTLVWHKSDGNMGGSVAPNSAEFLLVGTKGSPKCDKRLPSAVIKLPQSKQHSRKPKEWLWLIEQTGAGERLEMFARRKRPGWNTWGNEFENDVAIDTGAVAPAADSDNGRTEPPFSGYKNAMKGNLKCN